MKLAFPTFLAGLLVGQGDAAKPLPPHTLSDVFGSDAKAPLGANTAKFQKGSESKQLRAGATAGQKKKGKGKGKGKSSDDETCMVPTPAPGGSAVYTMENQVENKIVVYQRGSDGTLSFHGTVATTGTGGLLTDLTGPLPPPIGEGGITQPLNEGDPLGSSNAITVAGNCLLAVNAGSHDVSTFKIDPATGFITFASKVASGGTWPVSIAEKDDLVYVLNAGGNGHIQAFGLLQFNCALSPLGSPVELVQRSPAVGGGHVDPDNATPSDPPFYAAAPAQVVFTPEGDIAVVIKIDGGGQNFNPWGRPAGSLNFYKLSPDGTTSADTLTKVEITDRLGSLPFAMEIDDMGRLLVAEAFADGAVATGGGPGAGAISVWDSSFAGPPFQSDFVDLGIENRLTCWMRYNPHNQCAYVANSPVAGTVQAVSFKDGAPGVSATVAADIAYPLDVIISQDGYYVYVLSNLANERDAPPTGPVEFAPRIVVYKTDCECGLEQIQDIDDGLETRAEVEAAGGVFHGAMSVAVYPKGFS